MCVFKNRTSSNKCKEIREKAVIENKFVFVLEVNELYKPKKSRESQEESVLIAKCNWKAQIAISEYFFLK